MTSVPEPTLPVVAHCPVPDVRMAVPLMLQPAVANAAVLTMEPTVRVRVSIQLW